ncbi:MAG: proline--tRNA ligase, partial [Bacteroidetes bacterium HGW-Bacteroidetes-22]
DKDGQEKLMIMGCYGIGIGRTVAACIEQNNDANGIVWPMPLAPYHVIITPVNVNEGNVFQAAEKIYSELLAAGIEVVFDDRDERAGVKFKDADLIGIPLRVIIGQKNLVSGNVELKIRKSGETKIYPLQKIVSAIQISITEGLELEAAAPSSG